MDVVTGSWSCDKEHLCKLSFPHYKESPYEIGVVSEKMFENIDRRRMDGTTTD